jgi:hypothetical protein
MLQQFSSLSCARAITLYNRKGSRRTTLIMDWIDSNETRRLAAFRTHIDTHRYRAKALIDSDYCRVPQTL